MKKALCLAIILAAFWGIAPCAQGLELSAPEPEHTTVAVPSRGTEFSQGVIEILKDLIPILRPDLAQALRLAGMLIAICALICFCKILSGRLIWAASLAGILTISVTLLTSSQAFLVLGEETIRELSDYGKLLLPVMTAALSAQGGVTAAASLCTGTAVFDAVLTSVMTHIMLPAIYLFLALATVSAATQDEFLKRCKDLIKSATAWTLKTLLTCFTAYMGITGAVSGTTDKTALKATKAAISTAIPMVGSILSDASEAVLVSAAWVKNAAGIYGILAVLAVFLAPFFKIGIQYLILKGTSICCCVFGVKNLSDYIDDFSSAMGMLLGMTGGICFMLLISCISFLREVH